MEELERVFHMVLGLHKLLIDHWKERSAWKS